MTQPSGAGDEQRPTAEPRPTASDDTRLESLMAEVPASPRGWSAPPSRLPQAAQWLGIGAFAAGFAVVLDLALVRQGQHSIVAGGALFVVLLAGVIAAIAAITAGIKVRSASDSDGDARLRGAIAIGLATVALVLLTLAGLELYAIGLDTF